MSPTEENQSVGVKAANLSRIFASLKDPATKEIDVLTQERVDDMQSDRRLRESYAKWFIGILIGQLAVMNLVFITSAWIDFEPWALRLYMGGTLAQVFGIVAVITKYLFSRK